MSPKSIVALQQQPLFPSEARNDKVHPGSQKGCPLSVPSRSLHQPRKGTGLSSDASALVILSRKLEACWEHPSTPVYSAGGTAELSSRHLPSHQPSQQTHWLQHPSRIRHDSVCTTADGLGEGQAPKKPSTRTGSGLCQASECCIQSVQTFPGLFSQNSCPRCLCC